MEKPILTLYFGYDLNNIIDVEEYLDENYKELKDFVKYVGYGDDVMNAVELFNLDLVNDKTFQMLVGSCDRADFNEFI